MGRMQNQSAVDVRLPEIQKVETKFDTIEQVMLGGRNQNKDISKSMAFGPNNPLSQRDFKTSHQLDHTHLVGARDRSADISLLSPLSTPQQQDPSDDKWAEITKY